MANMENPGMNVGLYIIIYIILYSLALVNYRVKL